MLDSNEIGQIILRELSSIRDDQVEHTKILVKLQSDVEINTKDLTEHKEGVIQNRSRISSLEKPYETFKYIKKLIVTSGSIAAAVFAILKTLDYFNT